jgi:cell division protein FtsZ
MLFELDERDDPRARIKVIGVGGAGGNAVNRMIEAGLRGVTFIACNTDAQALSQSHAPFKIQIGNNGLGAGADPDVGRSAIENDRDIVAEVLSGSDMVFVTAGMGGGTGTGAAPIVAEIASELGALTVAVLTRPFDMEGSKRAARAEYGVGEMKGRCDTMIVIPNQRLLTVCNKTTSLTEAFRVADEVLLGAVRGIAELITVPGLINLDFADVRTVMVETGDALMGAGTASGEDRAVEAAREAIASPLLEDVSIAGARGLLVNITGGEEVGLHEVDAASRVVLEAAGGDANMIFGAVIDPSLGDAIRVTVIAAGFGVPQEDQPRSATMDLFPLSKKNLERPAFERREKEDQEVVVHKGRVRSIERDDLEVPTFIRKQMD